MFACALELFRGLLRCLYLFFTWYRGQLPLHCRHDHAKVCVLSLLLEKRSFFGIPGLSNVVSIHSQGQMLLSSGYKGNYKACLGRRECNVRHKIFSLVAFLKVSLNQMITHPDIPSVYTNNSQQSVALAVNNSTNCRRG